MRPLQRPCAKKKLFIKAKDNAKSDEDTGSKKQEAIGETFQRDMKIEKNGIRDNYVWRSIWGAAQL